MRIVFFGTPPYIEPIIHILKKDFDLVSVTRATDDLNVQELKKLNPDLFVVAAFGKILPKSILEIPKFGTLNIHPSLLPKYRGPSPIQSTILNGDLETGISFILLDQEVDHGPIIYVSEYKLTGKEDLEYLSNKLFQLAADNISKVLKKFVKGELKPIQQKHKNATYCYEIKKEDGFFDLSNPPSPEKLDRMIRAYYPWPTAWTKWPALSGEGENKILKFLPGERVQVEGKKSVSYKDFKNGYQKGQELLSQLKLL